MAKDWETLQEEQTIKTHALASQRSLMMAPDPIPLPLTQLRHTRAFAHAREYVRSMRTLAHSTPMTPLIETITTLWHLLPLAEVNFYPFVDNFHPKMNLVLDRKTFISMFPCFPHLSFDSPLGMVYELLKDCFVVDNFASGFDIFF
jgi:hypothetical protein